MTYLTTRQVAERLAMHPEEVRGLIRSGHLSAIDVSQNRSTKPRYRISEEELARFQRAREVGTHKATKRKRSKTKQVFTKW